MCIKKTKSGLMKMAMIFVSTSFAVHFIALISPLWLLVEIKAVNATQYTGNSTVKYLLENKTETGYIVNETSTFNMVNDSVMNLSRGFGLWYIVVCVNLNCSFEDYPGWDDVILDVKDNFDHGYNLSWLDSRVPMRKQKEYLIEKLLAVAILFVALIQIWYQKRLYRNDTRAITEQCNSYRHCGSLFCIVISGGLVWIPFTGFVQVNRNVKNFISEHKEDILSGTEFDSVTVEFPYSILFAGSGLVLSAIACMFVILTMSLRRTSTISAYRRSNEIPLSSRHRETCPQQSFTNSTDIIDGVSFSNETETPPVLSRYAQRIGEAPPSVYRNEDNSAYNSATAVDDLPPSYEEAMRLCVKIDGRG